MSIKSVNSYSEMLERLKGNERSFLLLYKKGSEQSDCAYENLKNASEKNTTINVLAADVNSVRDIHGEYNITSAPSLLVFQQDRFVNVFKGCQDAGYVNSLFEETAYALESNENGTPQKSVTVYSTPTCTWCNTLKTYLRKNRIRYTDIDVSQDPQAAEELVRRTGQQGVPQTEIDGEIIVGFDKTRINKLLGIS